MKKMLKVVVEENGVKKEIKFRLKNGVYAPVKPKPRVKIGEIFASALSLAFLAGTMTSVAYASTPEAPKLEEVRVEREAGSELTVAPENVKAQETKEGAIIVLAGWYNVVSNSPYYENKQLPDPSGVDVSNQQEILNYMEQLFNVMLTDPTTANALREAWEEGRCELNIYTAHLVLEKHETESGPRVKATLTDLNGNPLLYGSIDLDITNAYLETTTHVYTHMPGDGVRVKVFNPKEVETSLFVVPVRGKATLYTTFHLNSLEERKTTVERYYFKDNRNETSEYFTVRKVNDMSLETTFVGDVRFSPKEITEKALGKPINVPDILTIKTSLIVSVKNGFETPGIVYGVGGAYLSTRIKRDFAERYFPKATWVRAVPIDLGIDTGVYNIYGNNRFSKPYYYGYGTLVIEHPKFNGYLYAGYSDGKEAEMRKYSFGVGASTWEVEASYLQSKHPAEVENKYENDAWRITVTIKDPKGFAKQAWEDTKTAWKWIRETGKKVGKWISEKIKIGKKGGKK